MGPPAKSTRSPRQRARFTATTGVEKSTGTRVNKLATKIFPLSTRFTPFFGAALTVGFDYIFKNGITQRAGRLLQLRVLSRHLNDRRG